MRRYGRRRFSRRRPRRVYRTRGSKYIRRVARRTVRSLAETKFLTENINSNLVVTLPIGFSFGDNIEVGTGSNQRIGNKIQVKRISWRLNAFLNAASDGDSQAVMRAVLIYPRKAVATQEMLSYVSSNLSTSNRIDPTRFMTLYDKTFALSSNTYGNGANSSWRQLRGSKPSRYIFNYGINGSVDREPYLFLVSTLDSSNTTDLLVNGYVSTSYKDI